jgi:CRISPR-associated protein Cmr4
VFEKAAMLFLYCETPVHAGTGTSLSIVDLPIQRERITGLPIVQASSLKGVLRAETLSILKRKGEQNAEEKVKVLFGPEPKPGQASDHAGCVSPHDARLLLFPIRSLVGVFAWATCPFVLERFKREMIAAGFQIGWQVPNPANSQQALVAHDDTIVADGKVVLEEFAFEKQKDDSAEQIANWLRDNAFPQSGEYEDFRKWLPKRFVILPDDAFRDFTQLATEVIARIRLKTETKTVAEGALWTEEHLPSETLLYAPIFVSKPLAPNANQLGLTDSDAVLQALSDLRLDRLQIGGDETVGRGIVKVRLNVPTS